MMPGLKRRLFNLLAAVSLLFLFLVFFDACFQCWRTWYVGYSWQSNPLHSRWCQLSGGAGWLTFEFGDTYWGRDEPVTSYFNRSGWTSTTMDPQEWCAGSWVFRHPELWIRHQRPRKPATSRDHVTGYRRVGVPSWFAAMLFAVPPALFWRQARREQSRRKTNCCVSCGYDLRASKERCPECGTAIPLRAP